MSEPLTPKVLDTLLNLSLGSTSQPPFSAPNGRGRGMCVASQVWPRFDKVLPGEPLCVDIELQEHRVGDTKWHHRLGWIAIVNTRGEVILDCFVKYPYQANRQVKNPRGFGVTWDRLDKRNGAVDAHIVEKWVKKLFAGRDVILHGGTLDLNSFTIEDVFSGATNIHDTQIMYSAKYGKRQPALRDVAFGELGEIIQTGEHSPVQDAQATIKVYLKLRPFDRDAAWNNFNKMSAKEKAKYLATGPEVSEDDYQRTPLACGGYGGRGQARGRGGRGVARGQSSRGGQGANNASQRGGYGGQSMLNGTVQEQVTITAETVQLNNFNASRGGSIRGRGNGINNMTTTSARGSGALRGRSMSQL